MKKFIVMLLIVCMCFGSVYADSEWKFSGSNIISCPDYVCDVDTNVLRCATASIISDNLYESRDTSETVYYLGYCYSSGTYIFFYVTDSSSAKFYNSTEIKTSVNELNSSIVACFEVVDCVPDSVAVVVYTKNTYKEVAYSIYAKGIFDTPYYGYSYKG